MANTFSETQQQLKAADQERDQRKIQVRKSIALVILATGFAAQLARILTVESSTGEVPFLSANDRSRWCTIATLAVEGHYEIDKILEVRDAKSNRRVWYTIDLVRHRGSDGKQHYYSSKPPLLPTIYAGVYWLIRQATGASIMTEPFFPARLLIIVVNLVPLTFFWWLIGHWMSRYKLPIFAHTALMAFTVWGCQLTSFANTLNNHLPAAIAVAVSAFCIVNLAEGRSKSTWWFALCGLATSFAAANELPALSWVAAAGAILLIINPIKCLLCYVPALLPVAAAFFGTNYLAHGEFTPAYAHRNVGELIATAELPADVELASAKPEQLQSLLDASDIDVSDQSEIRPARRDGVFELWDPETEIRRGLKQAGKTLEIYQWGDWYDYEGSYWTSDRKQGVDKGEPNRAKYIAHCLVGHHGIFSLTPWWILSLLGFGFVCYEAGTLNFFRQHSVLVALAILATSLVSIGFYLARPLEDCNYGGVNAAFRWGLWLAPLWIWVSSFAIARVRNSTIQRIVVVLLALSVFSTIFPWDNPWTSPWTMQLLEWADMESWI